ncbi:uncharacterized protein LOC108671850 [Hyalella azteca]|uniref:Uncharacterized protein LOC108671850 n=1 Tax=Hyalella azteca TaxID=294128 RepID=A0A8B7NMN3_HYAAZ|nr:uncharacterized protein LOC108671850 [Hyalella azteca]
MNAVQSLVDKKRWLEAAQYVVDKGQYATVSQLKNEEARDHEDDSLSDEDCPSLDQRVVYGLIMSIKNPKDKENAKRLAYQRLGKPLTSYKRLILLREPQEGKAFYIIAANDTEAYRLFTIPNVAFVGAWVAIYEPQADGSIHGVPVLKTATSLVPIDLSPSTSLISLNSTVGGVTASEPVQTFLLEVPAARVKFEAAGLVNACSSLMCDSGEKATSSEAKCPAMAGGRAGAKALKCSVTVRKHGIYRVDYCSEVLAKLFISKTVLQSDDVDQDLVREGITELMKQLAAKGVNFVVGGWYKLSTTTAECPGEAAAQKRNVHISTIRPNKLLRNDELIQPPTPVIRRPPVATPSAAVPNVNMARFMTGNLTESSDDELQVQVHRPSIGAVAGTSGNTRRKTLQAAKTKKQRTREQEDEAITLEGQEDIYEDEITLEVEEN